MKYKLSTFLRILTCFLILIVAAAQRNGSIFGHDIKSKEATQIESESPLQQVDDTFIINTSSLAGDVKGYGGAVPLKITIKDDVVAEIDPLPNSETESFFNRARENLISQWIGTPIYEVKEKNVDAVSGATFSSNAFNANVKEGVAYYIGNQVQTDAESGSGFHFSLRFAVVLIVLLCAAIIPLLLNNKYYRYIQLLLNVVVLGFWSGTFLSYELLINYIANGANMLSLIVVMIMVVMAFIYPLFGRKSYYCAWVCPLGSLQELCGKSSSYKLKMSPKVVRGLSIFQEYLWYVLILLMVTGIWCDWVDYELFRAFIFRSAELGVIIAAIVFVVLSFIVSRPYCRFVCPTGYMFKFAQGSGRRER
ncbi:MAG: 4Fe-4S binding protein [Candidatus Amulumruptor caecigallinarius]|nr:4Fe-4S binding protein [Candidatus Amulumruptor caecigallinarius]